LAQRQAYQERRARGEERSLRVIAPTILSLGIETWGNLSSSDGQAWATRLEYFERSVTC
jgi:hypothetical protein